jgi:hypothetical protein
LTSWRELQIPIPASLSSGWDLKVTSDSYIWKRYVPARPWQLREACCGSHARGLLPTQASYSHQSIKLPCQKGPVFWDTAPRCLLTVSFSAGGTYRLRDRCWRMSQTGNQQEEVWKAQVMCFYPSTQRRYRRLIYYLYYIATFSVVRPSSGRKYIIT